MPGCGLAAYLGLLLSIMTLGGTMMLMSGLTIFSSSNAARQTRLMYGGDAEPYLLNPLHSVGLLQAGEVPDVFHAEDWTGMNVCALTRTEILRLGPDGSFRLALLKVDDVTESVDGVRITGPWAATPTDLAGRPQTAVLTEILCAFEANDGADRFARMLRAERAPTEAAGI